MNTEILQIVDRYNNWASNQFPNSTPVSSILGLKREIYEVKEAIYNYEQHKLNLNNPNFENEYPEIIIDLFHKIKLEYSDCLMYLIDSARRYGLNIVNLFFYVDIKIIESDIFDYDTNDIECLDLLFEKLDELCFDVDSNVNQFVVLSNYFYCILVLIYSARLSKINFYDLFQALNEKLEINLNRDWKQNEDKSYSHIK